MRQTASSDGENVLRIPERLELQRIAAPIDDEHPFRAVEHSGIEIASGLKIAYEEREMERRLAHRKKCNARNWLLLSIACVVTACSPRQFAERVALGSDTRVGSGVAYGNGPRQVLDVYRPGSKPDTASVIVFLYGGRWTSGNRREYAALARALTSRGWVVVIPDYRLSPEFRFPAWIEDGANAVRWTFANITRFGGDTTRVFVIGHSAGGHTAAMLALDETYLRAAGVRPASVRGFVSIAGPVATTWTDPDVQAAMGPSERWPSTYPATFIGGTEPPILLLHGTDDKTVSYLNSVRLASLIRQRRGCAGVRTYPAIGHVGIILAAMFPSLSSASVLDDIGRFVKNPAGVACPTARGLPVAPSPRQPSPDDN